MASWMQVNSKGKFYESQEFPCKRCSATSEDLGDGYVIVQDFICVLEPVALIWIPH